VYDFNTDGSVRCRSDRYTKGSCSSDQVRGNGRCLFHITGIYFSLILAPTRLLKSAAADVSMLAHNRLLESALTLVIWFELCTSVQAFICSLTCPPIPLRHRLPLA